MTSPLSVRPAQRADTAAITAIYNEGIRGRAATFETRERTTLDLEEWFRPPGDDTPDYPFLVAIDHLGAIVGWIRASMYRPRYAYRGIAEYSVYVATGAQGQRVGDTLMRVFLEHCNAAGITKLVSRIFPENTASLALCARHGFREVGRYERHGKLDDHWRDVIIVERLFPDNFV